MKRPASVSSIRNAARVIAVAAFLMLQPGLAPTTLVFAGTIDDRDTGSKVTLGVRNVPLKEGADALLAGDYEEGVRLTHLGLTQAVGPKEHEAALSNLCAGYLQLHQYETALQYCELLLARNDASWRGYNNRAFIYIRTEQWDKAEADLIKGEELNAGAYTMKVARAMYMDAVHPVETEIEIDDSEDDNDH